MIPIGFLACPGTLPGSPTRREDANEHDVQVAALRPAFAARGLDLVEIDWAAPLARFAAMPLVLLGTAWDYQDREQEFLARLDAFEEAGIAPCNSASIVRWNIDKRYLRELAALGLPTIPTRWVAQPAAADVIAAFEAFGCEQVVVKRQIGAGAEGQSLLARGDPAALEDWGMDRPAMIQPFLPAIQEEGEYSFVFVDGAFSHALVKRAAPGDYRIQSLYGGREEAITPSAADLASAQAIVDALPFDTAPLYARIDMIRGGDGALAVMEAELIEPYLYPEQGPDLGERMASAIAARVGAP